MRQPFLCLVIALPLLTALPALAAPGPADPKSGESTKSLDPADAFFEKGKAAFNPGAKGAGGMGRSNTMTNAGADGVSVAEQKFP
jgi:hypothetical protein